MAEPNDIPAINIDELIKKIPKALRPVAKEYGPALATMTIEEIWEWINLLVNGKTRQAFDAMVRRLNDAERTVAWVRLKDKWEDANQRNEARLALQRDAVLGVLKALLSILLVAVSL